MSDEVGDFTHSFVGKEEEGCPDCNHPKRKHNSDGCSICSCDRIN